jgi:hypothetical protein
MFACAADSLRDAHLEVEDEREQCNAAAEIEIRYTRQSFET